MSMTPTQKVAAQGRMLGRYAARMGEASSELARRGRQLENASEALDPVAAAGAHRDGIAVIVNMLKAAGRHLSRHVLGQDGDAPRFDLADAKISVFIPEPWPAQPRNNQKKDECVSFISFHAYSANRHSWLGCLLYVG